MRLMALGLDPTLPIMKAIGVREIADWQAGAISREQMIERAVIATRQYAKRQRTWFRGPDGATGPGSSLGGGDAPAVSPSRSRMAKRIVRTTADRGQAGREAPPDADAAQAEREGEDVADRKADHPIAEERDVQRHAGVGEAAQGGAHA